MKKLLCTALLCTCIGPAAAASYTLDPHHTNARFAADHHETSTNTGGFYLLEGKLQFDPVQKTGAVDIVIPLAKLNSGNPDFDQHLKTADFFHAEKFPEMRFVSEEFLFKDGRLNKIRGKLTIFDQTRPVTLKAKKFNCYFNEMQKKETCGGDFTAKIQPTPWGFKAPAEARLAIQVEAFKDSE